MIHIANKTKQKNNTEKEMAIINKQLIDLIKKSIHFLSGCFSSFLIRFQKRKKEEKPLGLFSYLCNYNALKIKETKKAQVSSSLKKYLQ